MSLTCVKIIHCSFLFIVKLCLSYDDHNAVFALCAAWVGGDVASGHFGAEYNPLDDLNGNIIQVH